MRAGEINAIAARLAAPHPEGLTLTTWGEQLKRDALELLAEVRRIRGGGDGKRKR